MKCRGAFHGIAVNRSCPSAPNQDKTGPMLPSDILIGLVRYQVRTFLRCGPPCPHHGEDIQKPGAPPAILELQISCLWACSTPICFTWVKCRPQPKDWDHPSPLSTLSVLHVPRR